MNGRLADAWPYSWDAIWSRLDGTKGRPDDLFMELYSELDLALKKEVASGYRIAAANDTDAAKQVFIDLLAIHFKSDSSLVKFFEAVFGVLDEFEVPGLTETYRSSLSQYLLDLNLRYRLSEHDILVPHLGGIAGMLQGELEAHSLTDEKLATLMAELQNSLANLKVLPNQSNAKGWITRSSVYTEGLAQVLLDSSSTLGKLCKDASLFPHKALADSLSSLYGFCSNYVGLRHAGIMEGSTREIELRDAVGIAVILLGLSGYMLPNAKFSEVIGLETKG